MKIGIFLTGQHPPGSDVVAELEGQYAMARLARDRGWDAVATGQHYLSDGVRQLQLIPFLARLAAEAGEMTGIAGVLLAGLHNPVEIAECIASLDAIWRGNFVFGVGLGYREVEFDAFGVPKGQRVRRFEQCLEVVGGCGPRISVSFENEICKLVERDRDLPAGAAAAPADLDRGQQRRRGAPRRSPRRQPVHQPARDDGGHHRADGALPRRAARATASRSRRCCPICARSSAPATSATAIEMAGPYLAGNTRPMRNGARTRSCPARIRSASRSTRWGSDRFVLGSPEECWEQLRPCWEEAGANFLIFRTHWSGMPVADALASMRLISDELLPALRRVPGGRLTNVTGCTFKKFCTARNRPQKRSLFGRDVGCFSHPAPERAEGPRFQKIKLCGFCRVDKLLVLGAAGARLTTSMTLQ